jgi:histidine triad (HIT) family protein
MPSDCIFCRIAAGEIPAEKLYEDEQVLAFRDIRPAAPTHAVIIPKAHIPTFNDVTEGEAALIGRLFQAAAAIARQEGLSAGYRLVGNCGRAAGQEVLHIHLHLLGGRDFGWPPG